MCDAELRLTYINDQAGALIDQGYYSVRNDQLTFGTRETTRILHRMAERDTPQRCHAFMLEPDGLPALGAMAMRIEGEDVRTSHADLDGAQLMIVAGRNHRASFANVDHLRDWFGLTPAEARLAATLAEGGSLADFAATRGISMNAVRFLLKGVFGKTDTNRQPELVSKLQATPLQWHIGSTTADLPGPLH